MSFCKICQATDDALFYASIKTYCKEHWKEKVRANRVAKIEKHIHVSPSDRRLYLASAPPIGLENAGTFAELPNSYTFLTRSCISLV